MKLTAETPHSRERIDRLVQRVAIQEPREVDLRSRTVGFFLVFAGVLFALYPAVPQAVAAVLLAGLLIAGAVSHLAGVRTTDNRIYYYVSLAAGVVYLAGLGALLWSPPANTFTPATAFAVWLILHDLLLLGFVVTMPSDFSRTLTLATAGLNVVLVPACFTAWLFLGLVGFAFLISVNVILLGVAIVCREEICRTRGPRVGHRQERRQSQPHRMRSNPVGSPDRLEL